MKNLPPWAVGVLIFLLLTSLGWNGKFLLSDRSAVFQEIKALKDEMALNNKFNEHQNHILHEFARLMCYDYPTRRVEAQALYQRLTRYEEAKETKHKSSDTR